MTDAALEFERLKGMHESAQLLKEGGVPLALLPNFAFRAGGKDLTMTLLLHPSQHSGYPTRLFFERNPGVAGNWTSHRVLDRDWCAKSWKDVSPSLPWTAILCEHLRAVA
jgi:hypothetical protein